MLDQTSADARVINDPDEFQGNLTLELFDWWHDLRAGRRAPLDYEFDHLDRPKLAKHLILLKAPPGLSELVIKYTGTEVTKMFGRDIMSDTVNDALSEDEGDLQWAKYNTNTQIIIDLCRKEIQPVINGPKLLNLPSSRYRRFESLTVPFVDETGAVNQTASLFDFLKPVAQSVPSVQ